MGTPLHFFTALSRVALSEASMRNARQSIMPVAIVSPKIVSRAGFRKMASGVGHYDSSQYAIDEINAYIAVRDGLLDDAEKVATPAKLERLALANEFVESCLKPARPPYQAQCLQETDAVRERKRCDAVKIRIEKLREQLPTAPSK